MGRSIRRVDSSERMVVVYDEDGLVVMKVAEQTLVMSAEEAAEIAAALAEASRATLKAAREPRPVAL
jgi:hypothetical protein